MRVNYTDDKAPVIALSVGISNGNFWIKKVCSKSFPDAVPCDFGANCIAGKSEICNAPEKILSTCLIIHLSIPSFRGKKNKKKTQMWHRNNSIFVFIFIIVYQTHTIKKKVTTTRTYSSSLPIYSSYPTVFHRSIPFVAHKRLVTGTRITTSPSRIITTRVIRPSPLRYIHTSVTPTRFIRASVTPSRFIRASVTPTRVITSPVRVINFRTRPSVLAREFKRIESRALTHPHYYATESYLNSEACRVWNFCLIVSS